MLRRAGRRVALLDRDWGPARRGTGFVARGADVRAYEVDVADERGVVDTARQVASDFGAVHLLVNIQHTPLRRFAKPDEIAETVLYLASPRSRYLTGQILVPDGGWTAFGWIPWSGDPEAPGIRGSSAARST